MELSSFLVAAWGLVVGLDLVSVAQLMVARPIVAGFVAGWLLGDPGAGMVTGVILELFALEVLPLGASWYPDYGLGAVAAAATATSTPGVLGTGVAVGVGLLVAWVGGVGIQWVRKRNSIDVRRRLEALSAGEVATITALHWRGLGRDALRALLVTGLGLVLAGAVQRWAPASLRAAVLASVVAVGLAMANAVVAGVRITGIGREAAWLVAGLALGIAWVSLA